MLKVFVLLSLALAASASFSNDYSVFRKAGDWVATSATEAHAAGYSHISEMSEKLSVMWKSAEETSKKMDQGVHARDATCDLARTAFVALTLEGGPCANIGARLALIYTAGTPVAAQLAAGSFCTECADAAKNAIANVAIFCNQQLPPADVTELRRIYYGLTVTCLQPSTPSVTNPYCVPTIIQTAVSINATTMVPESQLGSVCGGGCFLRFAAASIALNPDYETNPSSKNLIFYGALLCAQDSAPYDQTISAPAYCINQLINIATTFDGIPATYTVQQGFTAICATRCIAKYAVLTRNFDKEFFTNFTIVCHRDGSGALCVNRFLTFEQNNHPIDGICNIPDNSPQPQQSLCPINSGCRGNVTAFVSQLGCCATDFVYLTSTTAADRALTLNWLNNSCMANVQAPCPTFVQLIRNFVVYGLVSAYCTANPGVCEAAVLYDVALSLGLNQGDITVGSAAPGPVDGSTSFSLVFNTYGQREQTSTGNDYDNAVSSNSIMYSATTALPPAAKSNTFGALGTTDQVITFATGTTLGFTGGAAAVVPSLLLIAAFVVYMLV